MKILHTADWHLGKKLNGFSRHDEQVEVLREICDLADTHQVDLVLIAGDLFDNANPSSESQDLFYNTLHRLSARGARAVVAIAGNHDSPERIAAPDVLARLSGIILVPFPDTEVKLLTTEMGVAIQHAEPGYIQLKLPAVAYPVRLLLTPYANEVRLKKAFATDQSSGMLEQILAGKWMHLADAHCDREGVNLLMTHLYMVPASGEIELESEDERSIAGVGGADALKVGIVPGQIQYAALGHIHKYWQVAKEPCPVVYASSPLCYSFSEASQQKFVVVAEVEPGKAATFSRIPLSKGRKVLRYTAQDVDHAVDWLSHNPEALVELTVNTKTYLSAEDTRRLHGIHSYILDLIPQSSHVEMRTDHQAPDLSLDKKTLFSAYFEYKKGGQPSEALLAVLHEILSEA